MYSKTALKLDNIFSSSVDASADAIMTHSLLMKEFVETYKNLRQKEIDSYRFFSQHNEVRKPSKPCLLFLVIRERPLSKSKRVVRYFPEGEILQFTSITLARLNGKFTEHISTRTSHGYTPRQIVRLKNLRFQHQEQRNWTVGVIEQVNKLNATAIELRDIYLSFIDMHYNFHQFGTALAPADYHLKMRT